MMGQLVLRQAIVDAFHLALAGFALDRRPGIEIWRIRQEKAGQKLTPVEFQNGPQLIWGSPLESGRRQPGQVNAMAEIKADFARLAEQNVPRRLQRPAQTRQGGAQIDAGILGRASRS
jgi:hypothetical protein